MVVALLLGSLALVACGADSSTDSTTGGVGNDAAPGADDGNATDDNESTGANDDLTSGDADDGSDDGAMEGEVDGVSGSDDSDASDIGSDDNVDDGSPDDGSADDGTSNSGTADGGVVTDPGDGGIGLVPITDPNATLPKGVTIVVGTTADGGSEIQILCGTSACACSDGVDSDDDGLIDGLDSECTGPFDNDETTFSTGIPGDNQDPKWQDCFFDGNSGAGDDDCRYHTDCLTGDLPADDPSCQVTQLCKDTCQPLTPPGCDCFGCCEIKTESETLHVLIAETCSMENIDDEGACPRCQPTDICSNECGDCEICVGQTLADLPDSCFPPPEDPPPTGSGGSGEPGDDGGTPPTGNGGSGAGGSGNTDDTPPDDETPPDDSMPPDEEDPPPSNVCDGDAPSCVTTDDCPGTSYCSLGCCRVTFVVR